MNPWKNETLIENKTMDPFRIKKIIQTQCLSGLDFVRRSYVARIYKHIQVTLK